VQLYTYRNGKATKIADTGNTESNAGKIRLL
jgi:hypothetical protein